MKTTDIDRRAEVLELAGRLAVAALTREKFTDFKRVDETKEEAFQRLADEFGKGYTTVALAIINAVDEATAEKATSDSIVVREQVGWHSGDGIYGMGATPEPHWEPVYVLRPGATIEDKRDHEVDFDDWLMTQHSHDDEAVRLARAAFLAARGVKL